MGTLAILVLTVAILAYVFWPPRNLAREVRKTRVDYLNERREVIYDNLRDLNFEYQRASTRSRISLISARVLRMRRRRCWQRSIRSSRCAGVKRTGLACDKRTAAGVRGDRLSMWLLF